MLEKLAWVYEQQRDWRAALDVWRELPPEKQRERAAVAAHYCCELGEAALAAGDLDAARTQLAAARVHDSGRRARRACSRRASPPPPATRQRRSSCTPTRSARSRTMRVAFGTEAARRCRDAAAELRDYLLPLRRRNRPCRRTPRASVASSAESSVTWHWRCPGCRSWDSLRSANYRGV